MTREKPRRPVVRCTMKGCPFIGPWPDGICPVCAQERYAAPRQPTTEEMLHRG